MEEKNITIFEGKKIRRVWDEKSETWYFSVVDIIQILTGTINPTDYLKKIRKRDLELGRYIGTNCPQMQMDTISGKKRLTLAGNTKHLFRIIQSIPSKKAESIKLWLAQVGYERIQEISDPEKALNRSRAYWQKLGRSQKWIQQRMMGQELRNKLTDYWKNNKVKEKDEYAILTNIIHKEWSELTVKDHKNYKGLKRENLRDHMTDAELVFTALAELSTRQIAEVTKAEGLGKK
jgi:DNA-damage-inducible protein D